MRNSAIIEVIGYVGQDPKTPKPQEYPNFVTFQVGVSRIWKDKQGNEQKENTWFNCQTSTESMANIVKSYVKQGAGILVRGYPKVTSFIGKDGKANAAIEIKITELNILTYPKNKEIEESVPPESDAFYDNEIPF